MDQKISIKPTGIDSRLIIKDPIYKIDSPFLFLKEQINSTKTQGTRGVIILFNLLLSNEEDLFNVLPIE